MRVLIGLLAVTLLLGLTGCAVEGGYGGVYGEYPSSYYGGSYYTPGYVYGRPPYDRDHYWDRHRYWERGRWHHGDNWRHPDWDYHH
jgi:hypothetical protein